MKSLCHVLLLIIALQPLSAFDATASETAPTHLPQPVYIPVAEVEDTWRTPSGRIIDEQQIRNVNSRVPLYTRIRPSEL